METREKDNNVLQKVANVKMKKKRALIIIVIVALIVLASILALLSISHLKNESKTTKIGFEDINELDTQAAYCTVVDVIDDPRKIFGIEVPLTKSKCIYSYDVVIKAGLNFSDIKWEEKENKSKITVTMPKVFVTDSYIDEKSGKVYLEDESIFSPITFEEGVKARQELVDTALNDAVANGLLENAQKNAESILISFFRQHDEYKDSKIVFNWEE